MSEESKSEWKREISAGGIVYKKQDSQTFVLLVQQQSRHHNPPFGYWTFPKGTVETDEDKKDAAVREVREEGGVDAVIENDLGFIKFFRNSDKVLKFVDYFLMKYQSGDPQNHDHEVSDAQWFDINDVPNQLKWPHDKEVFGRAKIKIQEIN